MPCFYYFVYYLTLYYFDSVTYNCLLLFCTVQREINLCRSSGRNGRCIILQLVADRDRRGPIAAPTPPDPPHPPRPPYQRLIKPQQLELMVPSANKTIFRWARFSGFKKMHFFCTFLKKTEKTATEVVFFADQQLGLRFNAGSLIPKPPKPDPGPPGPRPGTPRTRTRTPRTRIRTPRTRIRTPRTRIPDRHFRKMSPDPKIGTLP